MKPPRTIYLQWHGCDRRDIFTGDSGTVPRNEDVTWCRDEIYDTDYKYVRVPKKPRRKKRKESK